MIVGSGLLAQAFSGRSQALGDACIYAAGVSNSGCTDPREFEREHARLSAALLERPQAGAFVYFSTCSVGDPEARQTPYVVHKLAMEALVAGHPNHLILRLPQVAGRTTNPHTLLNFLHSRILRSEAFSVWKSAYRNILDVDDVAEIACELIANPAIRGTSMNVASATSYPMPEIVAAMERVVGKRAIHDTLDRGCHYRIDVEPLLRALPGKDLDFGGDYLDRITRKYYERP